MPSSSPAGQRRAPRAAGAMRGPHPLGLHPPVRSGETEHRGAPRAAPQRGSSERSGGPRGTPGLPSPRPGSAAGRERPRGLRERRTWGDFPGPARLAPGRRRNPPRRESAAAPPAARPGPARRLWLQLLRCQRPARLPRPPEFCQRVQPAGSDTSRALEPPGRPSTSRCPASERSALQGRSIGGGRAPPARCLTVSRQG